MSFTAANGKAVFTTPVDGQTLAGGPEALTWTPAGAGTQGYYLTVGTTVGGYDGTNSGTLSAMTSDYIPVPPKGSMVTLHARIYTKIGGNFRRYQDVTFTDAG